jgi:glucans biosynthesis protein C
MPHGRFIMLNNGLGGALTALHGRMRVAETERTVHHFARPRDTADNRAPATDGGIERIKASSSSLALNNLRALVILVVVAFHSSLAYLGSQPASPFRFDESPFQWRAFPILDNHRWFGFDVFCAWQDVYLMALMFFLSALFTWPSLTRKGSQKFLADRLLRLGVPFAFAVTVLVPIALYPAYRVTADDPSLAAYARHYLALPFWPNGPMWFLWQLLALTAVAAALHRFAPHWVTLLGRFSSAAGTTPGRYFAFLVAASIVTYVPLAVAFTPWSWAEHGPLALQFSRPLLYGVFYLAGLGVGACGLGQGLLAVDGMLARRWAAWLAGALASVMLWMGLTAFAMTWPDSAPIALQVAVDSSFALACASGCFGVLASCLRFGTARSALFDSLANNAFGIYLLHYGFVVWLQYALLGTALFAFVKGMIVLAGALVLAWAATAVLRCIPFGSLLIGEGSRQRTPAREFGSQGRIRA